MPKQITVEPRTFQVYTRRDLDRIPQLQRFSSDELWAMKAVAHVLPFRVNRYVIDELIDWEHVPDDPMFRLTFPQREMLADDDYAALSALVSRDAPASQIDVMARRIRARLNPHPGTENDVDIAPVLITHSRWSSSCRAEI